MEAERGTTHLYGVYTLESRERINQSAPSKNFMCRICERKGYICTFCGRQERAYIKSSGVSTENFYSVLQDNGIAW